MECFSGIVDTGSEDEIRLDRYASEYLKITSRSQIKSRFKKNTLESSDLIEAKINGKPVKLSKKVRRGDRIELRWQAGHEEKLEAENISLDILYEDQRVVVVNKEQGMVVHPGAGNPRATLANALLYRRLLKERFPADSWQAGNRTGIVHRLDKDTSGVIIAAWDEQALAFLSAQFKAGTVKKRYVAIVHGVPPSEGVIDSAITRDPKNRKRFTVAQSGGKPALTRYRLIRSWGAYSLLLVLPRTGRTHQIRVHLKSIGHPVAGDPIYGPGGNGRSSGCTPSLMLHAYSLEITLPGQAGPSLFKAPLPSRFRAFMDSTWNSRQS
jgi:23S rRNA pseudouridine1911/1915/1917 synthase